MATAETSTHAALNSILRYQKYSL